LIAGEQELSFITSTVRSVLTAASDEFASRRH
jgi:hypothetical protein